jgi:hypothetical protein
VVATRAVRTARRSAESRCPHRWEGTVTIGTRSSGSRWGVTPLPPQSIAGAVYCIACRPLQQDLSACTRDACLGEDSKHCMRVTRVSDETYQGLHGW